MPARPRPLALRSARFAVPGRLPAAAALLVIALVPARPALADPSTASFAPAAAVSQPRTTELRLELGVDSPVGLLGVTLMHRPLAWLALEGSVGLGAGNYFGSVGVRPSFFRNGALTGGVAAGYSFGILHGGGRCSHGDSGSGTTQWVHGEAWLARGRGSLQVLVALGAQALVAGRYHIDVADVNLVDRRRGWVGPYARLGVGYAF